MVNNIMNTKKKLKKHLPEDCVKMKNRLFLIFILLICVLSSNSNGDDAIYADPDHIRSMMKWTFDGLPMVCVGENVEMGRFSLGGMIEVRNERRFNQGYFPNHNWRGIGKFQVSIWDYQKEFWLFKILTDIRHESAHPTMGIFENTDKAYEFIYDNVYRRMILNAVSFGSYVSRFTDKNQLTFRGYYHFLFLSKNTPELTGNRLTHGHAVSAGTQWNYSLSKITGIYLSLYDRYTFNSRKSTDGKLYCGNGSSLVQSTVKYPVIHHLNTIKIKTGLTREIGKKGRRIGVFLEYLYGNPFGFIDSRDKRSIQAIGFEFFH